MKTEFTERLGIELIRDASLEDMIKVLKIMTTPDGVGAYKSDSMEFAFANKMWELLLELKRYREKEEREKNWE